MVYTYKYRRAYNQNLFTYLKPIIKIIPKWKYTSYTHIFKTFHHDTSVFLLFFFFLSKKCFWYFLQHLIFLYYIYIHQFIYFVLIKFFSTFFYCRSSLTISFYFFVRYHCFFFFTKLILFILTRNYVTGWKGLAEVTHVLYNIIYCHNLLVS